MPVKTLTSKEAPASDKKSASDKKPPVDNKKLPVDNKKAPATDGNSVSKTKLKPKTDSKRPYEASPSFKQPAVKKVKQNNADADIKATAVSGKKADKDSDGNSVKFVSEERILEAVTPDEARQIGDTINFGGLALIWKTAERIAVLAITVYKFMADLRLLMVLMSTGERAIINVTATDKEWGIGKTGKTFDQLATNKFYARNNRIVVRDADLLYKKKKAEKRACRKALKEEERARAEQERLERKALEVGLMVDSDADADDDADADADADDDADTDNAGEGSSENRAEDEGGDDDEEEEMDDEEIAAQVLALLHSFG
ncbi:hypothetical protein F5Y14DRAFT_457470 [Nemania sp. NC0429]|nr:hypothetical protein F5Y14DRAFT_457470 [Nemania sp. NC0429]